MTDTPLEPTGLPSRYWYYALGLLLLAWSLEIYAIWSRPYAPLIDLPTHAARNYLEYVQLSGGHMPLHYGIEYRILPNLGDDLTVPLLLTFLGPQTACKVFLTISVLLYWVGPTLFIMQVSGFRFQSLTASLFLLPWTFSGQFFWGFLNYYSGFGLAFLTLAHYLRLSRQERVRWWQVLGHTLLVTLLFLWHLAPWGIYCVIVSCHLAVRLIAQYAEGRRLRPCLSTALTAALPLVPALGLFAYYKLSHHADGGPAHIDWGGWPRKLMMPLALFRAYDWRVDVAAASLWVVAVAVSCAAAFRQFHWKWIHLALGALCLLYLVLPFELGNGGDIDTRLLPAILVCVLASLASLPLQRFRPAALLLAACLLLRLGSVIHAWDGLSARLDFDARAFACLEPGSRVLPVVLVPDASKDYPERHFLAWAVPARHVFIPTLPTFRDQFTTTIDTRCPYPVRPQAGGYEVEEGAVREWYDYVWVDNPGGASVRMPGTFERVYSAGSLSVWRVR